MGDDGNVEDNLGSMYQSYSKTASESKEHVGIAPSLISIFPL